MFNPAQNTPAPSIRSSRRRQRSSNEGSISQPKAKRLRSAVNEKTFLPPDAENAPEMLEVKSTRVASLAKHVNGDVAPLHREVAVRGRKPRPTDQGGKGDGSVVLVCLFPVYLLKCVLTLAKDYERYIHCQQTSSTT